MSLPAKIINKLDEWWLQRKNLSAIKEIISEKKGVLIFCYHAINSKLIEYPYRTSPEAFDLQLSLIRELFDVVTVADAANILQQANLQQLARPVAAISFDDGYRCNFTTARPILKKHNLPATLFATHDFIESENETYISKIELQELQDDPLWHIGGHGLTHNVLNGLAMGDQDREISGSAEWLRKMGCISPLGFAYPQGKLTPHSLNLVREHFDFGLATDWRLSDSNDRHQLLRFCPDNSHNDLHRFAVAIARQAYQC